jgi:hypothetical protein
MLLADGIPKIEMWPTPARIPPAAPTVEKTNPTKKLHKNRRKGS